jgi:DNA invertase Pin-like site-specific DNA recombinase
MTDLPIHDLPPVPGLGAFANSDVNWQGRQWAVYPRNSKSRKDSTGALVVASQEVQEHACRAAIARLDPAPANIEVFPEVGRSGGGGRRRPQRDRLMEAVREGKVDAVIAYNAKRIGRNLRESAELWDFVAGHGARILCLDYPDLNNAMVRGAIFGGAEEEYKERQRYSREVLDWRRRRGLCGNKSDAAFGLRWEGETLATVADEIATVEMIYKLSFDCFSMNEIARELTRRERRRRNGCTVWDVKHVSRILHCEWYVGRVRDGRHEDGSIRYWNAGQIFVDAEIHAAVRRRVGDDRRAPRRFEHAISGLLFCGVCCGPSPMSLCRGKKIRNDGSVYERHRYRCIHHVRDPESCPSANSIDALYAEEHLVNVIAAELGCDELAPWRFARRRRLAARDADELADACDQRALGYRTRQDALRAQRLNGEVIPDRLYNAEMQQLVDEETSAISERDEHRRRTILEPAAVEVVRAQLGPDALAWGNWQTLRPARRREFLGEMFPYGVFVLAKPAGARGVAIDQRLAPRTPVDLSRPRAARTRPTETPG